MISFPPSWKGVRLLFEIAFEGVVMQWFNPLTLQSEQSGGVGLIPNRMPPLERYDKGSRTQLSLLISAIPVLGTVK